MELFVDWAGSAFSGRGQRPIAILERFNRDRIEFAYPTTTNFTAGPDGGMIMPYPTKLSSVVIEPTLDDDDTHGSREGSPSPRG